MEAYTDRAVAQRIGRLRAQCQAVLQGSLGSMIGAGIVVTLYVLLRDLSVPAGVAVGLLVAATALGCLSMLGLVRALYLVRLVRRGESLLNERVGTLDS